jgi:hypothetical protein
MDRKNAWIVHRVNFVETKTLIHPHALIVYWENFQQKWANRFAWGAMQELLPTNTVRRSAKCAQRGLHKVRNEVPHAINALRGNFLLKLASLCVSIATKEPIPKRELLSAKPVLRVKLPPSKVNLPAKPVLQGSSQRWGRPAWLHPTWLPKVAPPTNI